MKNDLTQLLAKPFTRRKFLEGVGAVGATAALASCGGAGSGPQSLFKDNPANVPVPPINGVVVAGSAPHNCGGRCVTKAYVENGVIKRFVTDERPDKNVIDGSGDDPQRRGCIKCRAQKGFMYRSDRVLKPLKQMGARGDLNGFVEISWDQAFTEIALQLQAIANDPSKGWKTLHAPYASGSSGSFPSSSVGRLLDILGGQQNYRTSYSYPGYDQVGRFVLGGSERYQQGNMRQDLFNANQIILWSMNPGDTVMGTNTMWYLEQAKEKGIPIISIDARINQTTAAVATQKVMVMPGTDAALIAGMIYHLIAEPSLDGKKAAGTLVDFDFIKQYVHGFFDDATPTLYQHKKSDGTNDVTVDPTTYNVPAGASFSAYVLGSNTFLTGANVPTPGNPGGVWNSGTSVYPDKIGYNYVDPADPLTGKVVDIWGNVPKTPEWAEKICGVPAATIRKLAENLADPSIATTCWECGGIQRTYEQEQAIWMLIILSHITKNFGLPGRSFGFYSDRNPPISLTTSTILPALPTNTTPKMAQRLTAADYGYDVSKLTAKNYTSNWAQTTFPVFLWSDIAKNGGTGKSDWNDPQTMKSPAMKALLNFGGNILVNQTGDSNGRRAVLADRSKVELIVVADHYLTPSAAMADYVLPAATAWEKANYTTTSYAGEHVLSMGKAVEPLGQAMDDFYIVAGIADKLGKKDLFTGGHPDWTSEDWVKAAYNATPAMTAKMSYDDWKASGILSLSNPATPLVPAYKDYRANPSGYPKATPSGKAEAYCQSQVEDYIARGYNNVNPSTDPAVMLRGPIAYKGSSGLSGRFVYPVPMYIPLYEGRHANQDPTSGIPHPDPLGLQAQGYTCLLNTFHIYYRSHSTHAGNAFINEVFKKDAKGQPAFFSPKRARGAVWDDGVYEPIWINPATATQYGISHGDRVLVTSLRGRVYATANVTQRCAPYVVHMGQGAWHQLDGNGVDVGGNVNTLTPARPSRIGQGMTSGNGTLVKIQKA